MKIQDNGVLCSCGEFHEFSEYYYANTYCEITLKCKCGMECVLFNDEIVKINKKDHKKEW